LAGTWAKIIVAAQSPEALIWYGRQTIFIDAIFKLLDQVPVMNELAPDVSLTGKAALL
jgi:hypothetical protein